MYELLLIPLMAFLNRFRGGGFGAVALPGHPRYYVFLAVLGVMLLITAWLKAVILAVCYLAWSMLAWGHWYDLERMPDGFPVRELNWFEKLVEKVSPNDWVSFTIRNFVSLIPAMVLITPWAAFGAVLQTGLYELAWRVSKKPITVAELLTGAAWGAFFALVLV